MRWCPPKEDLDFNTNGPKNSPNDVTLKNIVCLAFSFKEIKIEKSIHSKK